MWYCVFIVGGVIKRYSYFLVPHIIAENPNIKAKDAINLSRKMMYGHKWECFVLEMSFIGWFLLKVITLGLSGLFYSNAYQIAAYTAYYVRLRDLAKQSNVQGSALLNDTYLYEVADATLLKERYEDVVSILNTPKTEIEAPRNAFEKVLRFFGIALSRNEKHSAREVEEIKEASALAYETVLHGEEYPMRLFSLPERMKESKGEATNYMMRYTIPTLVLMFFIFSFIGWTWEVVLHLIDDGKFVNRGTMHGPWLPIYGSGGLLIITMLYSLRKRPILHFAAAVVLCGIVEYFTAYYLEFVHNGQKWWDYTGYFLNLHGRICGEGLLVFGLGGAAVVYVLAPILAKYISKMKQNVLLIITCILVIFFIIDAFYTKQHPNAGEGITSYRIVEQTYTTSFLAS